MKIISWNVNWIRAVAKKWFVDFVESEKPDILAIQETKAFEEQFLNEVWNLEWYKYIWHIGERPWYAWTAIFYKEDLDMIEVKNRFWEIESFHEDWRLTQIEFYYKDENWNKKNVVLINWYFPNWWTRADGTEMVSYKLNFYNKIIKYTRDLKKQEKQVIITWDLNICHREIDIARPKENENSIWFLPIEREKIWELIDDWNLDVYRNFYPDKKDVYSWWSYRAGARPRNIWWRIDYFLVNRDFIQCVEWIYYMNKIMGSDHCPVKLELR